MKRYVVKRTLITKENHPDGAGIKKVYYMGIMTELIDINFLPAVECYGYKTEYQARRNYYFNRNDSYDSKYHDVTCEIVEIEV